METGILAIDSMFPIGRGQRELIIGDRQTGKTSIAVDAIVKPEGQGRDLHLRGHRPEGIHDCQAGQYPEDTRCHGLHHCDGGYCHRDPAPLTVYRALCRNRSWRSIFMYQGRDVLIVYDDLSKHAVAYRALSLLLERSPGREAYPGDVFYLHSRLLERSSKTYRRSRAAVPLPHCPSSKPRRAMLSAYIPTNVISITDGQIFLES